MSQRKQCSDKARVKQSAASLKTDTNNDNSGGDGLSTGGWHRRSLFSSERLDLILSNPVSYTHLTLPTILRV